MIVQASAVAHWLEDCQTTIDEACAPHENINASQKELLKNCSTIMHSFKKRSEACQVGGWRVWRRTDLLCFLEPDDKLQQLQLRLLAELGRRRARVRQRLQERWYVKKICLSKYIIE